MFRKFTTQRRLKFKRDSLKLAAECYCFRISTAGVISKKYDNLCPPSLQTDPPSCELQENKASKATILVFTYANKKIIPQNCCVPGCTKVYEENGMKISFQKFSEDKDLFRKWIFAIRRDVGNDLKVTDYTRVCSRHFKAADYFPSLKNRKRILKPAAVPSVLEERIPSKEEVAEEKKPHRKKNLRGRIENNNCRGDKCKFQFHA